MTEPAIEITNLSKAYRIGTLEARPETLAGRLLQLVRAPVANYRRLRDLTRFLQQDLEKPDVVWALRDVTFRVAPGEVVGVIGANGAGKSTLLKILAGITEPTSGRAIIRGRIASLLEVGTGMHPELTGRENVFLTGTLLGMKRREVAAKFEEIVEFAEVERFIDTPVKRYSSGMKVRLGFAIAAHLEPEVLLVDEVLAVGDAAFQQKCLGRMAGVAAEGRTVLFVSHNMNAVSRLCPRSVLISRGRCVTAGPSAEVIARYLEERSLGNWRAGSDAGAAVRLTRFRLLDLEGETLKRPLFFSEGFGFEAAFESRMAIRGAYVVCRFETHEGTIVSTSASSDNELVMDLAPSKALRILWTCRKLPFLPGRYRMTLSLHQRDGKVVQTWWDVASLTISAAGAPPRFARVSRAAGVVFLSDSRWVVR